MLGLEHINLRPLARTIISEGMFRSSEISSSSRARSSETSQELLPHP